MRKGRIIISIIFLTKYVLNAIMYYTVENHFLFNILSGFRLKIKNRFVEDRSSNASLYIFIRPCFDNVRYEAIGDGIF